jgi:hypothetical protein
MSETKTVQRMIKPITVRCGTAGCATKPVDAVLEVNDGGKDEIIAPKGWTFPKGVQGKGDVYVGACPAHSAK